MKRNFNPKICEFCGKEFIPDCGAQVVCKDEKCQKLQRKRENFKRSEARRSRTKKKRATEKEIKYNSEIKAEVQKRKSTLDGMAQDDLLHYGKIRYMQYRESGRY